MNSRYKFAVSNFERAKAKRGVKVENVDKSADFTKAKDEKYFEPVLKEDKTQLDIKGMTKKNLTQEDIDKNLEKIEKAVSDSALNKSDDNDADEQGNADEKEDDDQDDKGGEEGKEDIKKSDDQDTDDKGGKENEKGDDDEDDIKKSLNDITTLIKEKNHSVGVILKGIFDLMQENQARIENIEKSITEGFEKGITTELESKTDNSAEILKALEVVTSMEEKINSVTDSLIDIQKSLDAPVGRKSVISAPRDRNFGANEDIEKAQGNGNQVAYGDRKKMLNILDNASFEKGFDNEFAEALTRYESGAQISDNVIARLAKFEHPLS